MVLAYLNWDVGDEGLEEILEHFQVLAGEIVEWWGPKSKIEFITFPSEPISVIFT